LQIKTSESGHGPNQQQHTREEKEDVMKKLFRNFALTAALGLATIPVAAANQQQHLTPLEKQVRHELVTMPYYSVFDNLVFQVEGSEVTLSGQTIRPTIKSSAARLVGRLEGVTAVNNKIEVLPVSFYDNNLRRRLVRAIYSNPVLDRLGLGAVPGIHVIVRNGNVTLEGVVANQAQKNVAFLEANGVSGAFKVTNNLRVENPKKG